MATAVADLIREAAEGQGSTGYRPFASAAEAAALGELREVPTDEVHPDPDQPRKDLGDLEELKRSIESNGILQPIIVTPRAEGGYQVLAGERRTQAAKALGRPTVPVIIRSIEDHKRLELQLIENLQRKDLNPFEEADSYRRLMEQHGITQEKLADDLGRSQQAISDSLRVLDLAPDIQEEYWTSSKGGKARAAEVSKSLLVFIARGEEKLQHRLWRQAKEGKLTVAKARDMVAPRRKQKAKKQPPRTDHQTFEFDGGKVTFTFAPAGLDHEQKLELARRAVKQLSKEKAEE